ncbi:MAG: hypothetical protein GWN64_07865 [Candidatus Thorarchaeota archaeon]|nr:hypothetical protein [Candidatus Thorarchaeota archaeon]
MARTKEEKQARRAEKNNAYDVIFKFIEAKGDEAVKKALATVRPSLYGIRVGFGGGGTAAHDTFLSLFEKVGASINEGEIFNQMKAGRKECAAYIRRGLKKYEPKERKWVSFDPDSGVYKLEAIGEKEPKGWTGYVPVEVEVEELA